MGVPRLNRFICERFPYSIRAVTRQSHRVDHLYIDFNGLIHESTLRASYAPLDRSEADVFSQTYSYFLHVVDLLQPRNVFIAIDGAAPSAKIRQQRQRRIFGQIQAESQAAFRSKVSGYGDEFNSHSSVSSAEITPGAEFMSRLQSYLVLKIAENIDNGIIDCTVEFSGSDVPGEGEHKILAEIRKNVDSLKFAGEIATQTGYKPEQKQEKKKLSLSDKNEHVIDITDLIQEEQEDAQHDDFHEKPPIKFSSRCNPDISFNEEPKRLPSHCVFGLDGDLILLLLGLNIPELTLVKRFTGLFVSDYEKVATSKDDPWQNGIIAMDIDSVREGLIYELLQNYFEDSNSLLNLCKTFLPPTSFISEFTQNSPSQLKQLIREQLIWSDISERLIHDFIALALFVGNDFLPQVPGQSIKNGALDQFISLYKKENLSKIPFKFLLDERKQIDLTQISKLFQQIGDEIEFGQVVSDMQEFCTFASKVKTLSAEIGQEITREYDAMVDYLGIEVVNSVRTVNRYKIKDSANLKNQVMGYYRKKYYEKFEQLQVENQVRSPVGIGKAQLKSLAILDQYENLKEQKAVISKQLQNYVDDNMTCCNYRGLHHLIRTYLKTMQWVIDYYLQEKGLTQWSWEFSYPFTPLCSDMAIYCKLFTLDVQEWNSEHTIDIRNTKLMDQKQTSTTQDIEFEKSSTSEESSGINDKEEDYQLPLELSLLQDYKGPKFVFVRDSPHDVLTALLFTLSKQKLNLVPQKILDQIDASFFDNQPTYQNVEVIHYESAFKSLNQILDLSKPNLNFLNKRKQHDIGFGWNPNFTVFYKHYPLGLADGIDFKEIENQVSKINQNDQYYKSFYKSIGNIIITKQIYRSDIIERNIKNYKVIAGPGSQITENCVKTSLDQKSVIFNQFFKSQLIQTFILIPSESSMNFDNIFYAQFSQPTTQQVPTFNKTFVSRYRGLHLLTETSPYLSFINNQLNIIAKGIRGNCLSSQVVSTTSKFIEQKCQNSNYYNSLELNILIDQFIDNYSLIQQTEQNPSSIIPNALIEEFQNHTELEFNTNQLVSYENDYYGQILGYYYHEALFMRSIIIKDNKKYLGQFREITDTFKKCMTKLDIKSDVDSIIQNLSDQYYQMNKGRSINKKSTLVFFINDPSKLIDHQSWIMSLLTAQKQYQEQQYPFLAFLDKLPVTFSPIGLVHRKLQRTNFIRTRVTNFAYVISSIQELQQIILSKTNTFLSTEGVIVKQKYSEPNALNLSQILIQNFGRIIPIDAIQFNYKKQTSLIPLPATISAFQIILPKLTFTNSDLSKLSYNKQAKNLPTNMQLYLNFIKVVCQDDAIRDVGLNISNQRYYDPNYMTHGVPNQRTELGVHFMQKAFPSFYKQLFKLIQGKGKFDSMQFQTNNGKENLLSGIKNLRIIEFSKNQVPIYDATPYSQLQLASLVSYVSLMTHKFIFPLQTKMMVPKEFSQHFNSLIISKLSTYLSQVRIENKQVDKVQEAELYHKFKLGDIVLSEKYGIVAVIAVSENKFRFISTQHLFSFNDCYKWNVQEAEKSHDGYYLIKSNVVNIPQDIKDISFNFDGFTSFEVNPTQEIDQWKTDERKTEEFKISFD